MQTELFKVARRGLIAASFSVLCACAETTPVWDASFGTSVKTAVAQQTLDPDASRNDKQVTGMDGRSAREAINRYQKSFVEKEPQPNVFTIGVSSGK